MRITTGANLAGACPVKDAMPGGPGGSWAYRGCRAVVWAPSVVHFNGRWILYYAASKAGSGASCRQRGQVCLGKAYASSPAGPFRDAGEVACPGNGRWALDADAFVAGKSCSWSTATTPSPAVPRPGSPECSWTARAIWNTRHTLATSRDISWDTENVSGGTHVIENPSMAYVSGAYRMFFSGNNWNSARYAVGLANCGSSPVNNTCAISGSTSRPWFGYSKGGLRPLHPLPGNHPGPGGLSVFKTASGSAKIVWHWYAGSSRPALIGSLNRSLTVS